MGQRHEAEPNRLRDLRCTVVRRAYEPEAVSAGSLVLRQGGAVFHRARFGAVTMVGACWPLCRGGGREAEGQQQGHRTDHLSYAGQRDHDVTPLPERAHDVFTTVRSQTRDCQGASLEHLLTVAQRGLAPAGVVLDRAGPGEF